MGKEYRTRVFKSGNSVALRLPKALGLVEGSEMSVREARGRYIVEPVAPLPRKIDLTGIYGSARGLVRLAQEEADRDWSPPAKDA